MYKPWHTVGAILMLVVAPALVAAGHGAVAIGIVLVIMVVAYYEC